MEVDTLETLGEMPEVRLTLTKMREFETQIQTRVDEETWQLFVQWETLWAEYLSLAAQHVSAQEKRST